MPMEKVMMRVGTAAPDFVVRCGDELIGPSAYRGKWLVLFFISADCPSDLAGFAERFDEFTRCDADLLGASAHADAALWAHIEALGDALGGLPYRFFEDVGGAVSHAYGLRDPKTKTSSPGLFIIDPEGVLKYMAIAHEGVGFSVDEILRVLQTMQGGRFCLAFWTPGKPAQD